MRGYKPRIFILAYAVMDYYRNHVDLFSLFRLLYNP